MNELKKRCSQATALFKEWLDGDKNRKYVCFGGILIVLIFLMSGGEKDARYVFKNDDFKKISKSSTVDNPYRHIADDKMALFEKAEMSIRKENKVILTEMESMRESFQELSAKLNDLGKKPKDITETQKEGTPPLENVNFGASPIQSVPSLVDSTQESSTKKVSVHEKKPKSGPYSVVFPVEVKANDEESGVVIGKGSRAYGKVIGGAEVPMGETYPVLIQLDHAFIMANNKKVDLKGCVLIAKSETVFATGKMKMEPDSITCYGPSGSHFTQNKIKGWFNDPKDDNFGMSAELKTNAGNKSLGVFGQSFVEGLGAAIERGSRSVGGQGVDVRADVVLQNSGQQAGVKAGQLFMEYLNGLKPTLKVTSGRDTWLILGSDLVIPYEFFRERKDHADKKNSSVVDFIK